MKEELDGMGRNNLFNSNAMMTSTRVMCQQLMQPAATSPTLESPSDSNSRCKTFLLLLLLLFVLPERGIMATEERDG